MKDLKMSSKTDIFLKYLNIVTLFRQDTIQFPSNIPKYLNYLE